LRSSKWKAVLVVAFAVASAACGADRDDSLGVATTAPSGVPSDGAPATYPSNGQTADVLSIDNTFLPQDLTVAAGTEVVFTNNGRNPHNVLPEGDEAATVWGVLEAEFLPGDVYTRVFDTPGTYVYYCSIHGTPTAAMYGTITVTEP